MSVLEYALDVEKDVEEIKNLCSKLGIKVDSEETNELIQVLFLRPNPVSFLHPCPDFPPAKLLFSYIRCAHHRMCQFCH